MHADVQQDLEGGIGYTLRCTEGSADGKAAVLEVPRGANRCGRRG